MEPEQRGILRDAAAETVNDALDGTPLAGVGDLLRKSPALAPPHVINPPTSAGTLAGRNIKGTIAAPIATSLPSFNQPAGPVDNSTLRQPDSFPPLAPGVAGGKNGATFSPEFMPPAREDSTVRSTYLSDLAQWLADRYRPGPNGGTLAVDARGINHLCGVELAARARGGRSALLRYAFQPSMIRGLYDLYINQFMSDLDAAAKKRGWDAGQTRDFHLAIAGRVTVVANMLDGIMKVPDLSRKLDNIDVASQKAVDLNAQLANAVFELDELRDARASSQQIKTARMRVDGITARYRRAMDEQATARQNLVSAIGKEMGQPADEDSALFMAAWVERRRDAGGNATESLEGMSGVLRDFVRRCKQ